MHLCVLCRREISDGDVSIATDRGAAHLECTKIAALQAAVARNTAAVWAWVGLPLIVLAGFYATSAHPLGGLAGLMIGLMLHRVLHPVWWALLLRRMRGGL
jgi:hypothetical protein